VVKLGCVRKETNFHNSGLDSCNQKLDCSIDNEGHSPRIQYNLLVVHYLLRGNVGYSRVDVIVEKTFIQAFGRSIDRNLFFYHQVIMENGTFDIERGSRMSESNLGQAAAFVDRVLVNAF